VTKTEGRHNLSEGEVFSKITNTGRKDRAIRECPGVLSSGVYELRGRGQGIGPLAVCTAKKNLRQKLDRREKGKTHLKG